MLLNAYYFSSHYVLALPFYSICLSALHDNPSFVPSDNSPAFEIVVKSLSKQMCEAVSYLSEKGIAHRDIAPSNWILNDDGLLVLIDFGVAWMATHPGEEGPKRLQFELGTG